MKHILRLRPGTEGVGNVWLVCSCGLNHCLPADFTPEQVVEEATRHTEVKHDCLVTTDENGFVFLYCSCTWKQQFGHQPKLEVLVEAAAEHLLEHERSE